MPAEMKLIEETPTKIVLETDPSSRTWADYLRILLIPVPFLAAALIIPQFQTWMDWVIITLAILIGTVVILVVYSTLVNVTVIIDAQSQRATRIEKILFIRMKRTELDFNQITRVLIHCEEHGHHCRMMLDSTSNKTLEIDFYLPFEEKQEAWSRKIGSLLRKPVVVKVTDMGNLISEETIQD